MGFFRKIFGYKKTGHNKEFENNLAAAHRIVADYGDFMQSSAFPTPGCIADTKKLPYDKERIKRALILAIKLSDNHDTKQTLKVAYSGLADFQDGVGESDIGLDTRRIPELQNIDSLGKAQLESIMEKTEPMMRSYDEFCEKVEAERELLWRDVRFL
jgi:hypothetical protein